MATPTFADVLTDLTKDRRRKLAPPQRSTLTMPRANFTGAPADYGRSMGSVDELLRSLPDNASTGDIMDVIDSGNARARMPASMQGVAEIGVGNDLPVIRGQDVQQRDRILESIRPQPHLSPANVGMAARAVDPLSELRMVQRAMGGQDPRDLLSNLRNTEGMTEQAKARERMRTEDIGITDRRMRQANTDVLGQITAKGAADAGVAKATGEANAGVEVAKGDQARKQMEADRMDALIREKLGIPKTAEWDAKLKELQDAWQSGVNAGQYGAAGRTADGKPKDRVQQLLEDLKNPEGAAAAPPATVVPAPLRQAGPFATGSAGSSGLASGTLNLDLGQNRQPSAPADPEEGKVVTQNGRRYVKRNGQWVEG